MNAECAVFSPSGVPVFIRDLTMLSGCVSQLARLPCLHKARITASDNLEGTPALPLLPAFSLSWTTVTYSLLPPAPILAPSHWTQHGRSLKKKKKNSLFLAALDLHWAFSSCSKCRLHSSCGAWTSHCSSFSCGVHGLECLDFFSYDSGA